MAAARDAWLAVCGAWLLGCQAGTLDAPSHQHVAPLTAALRPLPGMASAPPSFGASDRIEHYDSSSGFFRVQYTRSGRHAVPAEDADGDGVPDYVRRVADDFDEVLGFYRELGYRDPRRDGDLPGEHGGDDRFDVYLLDFPNAGADGQFRPDTGCAADSCSGYMLLENDFAGKGYTSVQEAIRLVSSHELFHAVQQAYATAIGGLLSEGTAVWASEAFDAQAGDLERQVPSYLERPDFSLAQDPSGTDPIRYGSALFFEFIDEHAGRDRLLEMWQKLADGAAGWQSALDDALRAQGSSLGAEFATFAEWNLYTGQRADPERAYAHAEMFPLVKERDVEAGYRADALRVFPLAARYYALHADADQTLTAAAALPDAQGEDDLELLVALEQDGEITRVEHADKGRTRSLQLELSAGDSAHVVLYNTRLDGGSLRPNLCIGGPEVKDSCGASQQADAGRGSSGSDAPQGSSSGGCAVRVAPRDRGSALLCLLGLAALSLRRRGGSRAAIRRGWSRAAIRRGVRS